MTANVVEITITAVNDSKAGMDEAKAGAAEVAGSLDDEAAAADRATGSLDELEGAQIRVSISAKGAADAQEGAAAKTTEAAGSSKEGSKALKDLALGAGIAAAGAIYMGVKFQEGATQLVTGAGQSAKGLKQVEQGMLGISTQTATSSKDVEAGMYMIESAGFHGAQGLEVLKAAAEGAKVGNANLGDMANVVTSALNAYHEPAAKAVSVTNQLVATVASGKMHMQDLATALANVLPIAASAHISLAQVGGAMATMTSQGMTARRASMNLANMIRSLISPSATSSAEMRNLGINANHLAGNIGKVGLTGTLDTLTEAILKNSKGGTALAATFSGMDPATKGYARAILAGSVTTKQLTTDMQGMNPVQAAMLSGFEKTASSATGIKTTFDGAMKTMTGGATGLNVALLLGGQHAKTFAGNVSTIDTAAKKGGSSVAGWGAITKDTAFKLDQARVSVENLGISVGMALLPAVDKILGPVESFVSWLGQSKVAVDILAGVIVGALAGFAVVKAVEGFQRMSKAFSAAQDGITSLLRKLGLMAPAQTAAAAASEEQAAASETLTAATEEQAVATGEAEVAQDGLNLAMLANPITLIIAGIALLVVAVVELVRHWHAVATFFEGLWHDLVHIAESIYHDVTKFFEKLRSDEISIVKGLVHDVVSFFTGLWHDITNIASDLWSDVTGFFERIWHDCVGFVTSLWHDEVRGWTNIWHDVTSLVSRLIHDVETYFSQLPGKVVSLLEALPGDLLNLGKEIIEGLIHGIESGVSDLIGTVSHLASDVTGAFKSVLGIFSPSRVFTEHGRDIVRGLVQGISGESPSALAAIRRLGGSLALGSAGGGAYGGGGGAGGVFRMEITGGAGAFDAFLVQWMRQHTRILGGGSTNSAQRAWGQVS